MKKVLYTATVLSHVCQFHLPYLKEFKENGYEVHVAAKNNLAEKNGLELKYADKFIEMPFSRSPKSLQNLKALKQLKKLLKEEYYDLIVCNTPMGGIITRMAAKKTRKKGTKVVYMAHGFHFYKGASKKNWLVFYPIEKYFAKKCDMLITINKEDYKLAKQKFKTRIEHIYGVGVDGNRYFPLKEQERINKKEQMGFSMSDFIILVVGELLKNKNQIQVIKAVESLVVANSEIKLLIAGNGKDREYLEQYVNAHGLSNNVQFLGYCTHLEDYQQIADIGVSCSEREGLGLNVIESMLSGNVFVATRNRGHQELICDGEDGFLVDINDWETLSKRLAQLFDDKLLRENLASKAKEKMQIYELENVLKQVKSLFELE